MPTIGRKRFKPSPCPEGLCADDKIFYLPVTNEVFTSYDDFFQRQIILSSMIWTCAATGKTGLTFEEALDSERSAQEALRSFPDTFAKPILFLVQKLSCRGRVEDLINDIYFFVKDRYFIGENLTYIGGKGKKQAQVVAVSYNEQHGADNQAKPTAAIFLRRGHLMIGEADAYTYRVSLEQKNEQNGRVIENIKHYDLLRQKSQWSRSMIRIFLKSTCTSSAERIVATKEIQEKYGLDALSWTDIFAGPVALFPQTPAMQRGPIKGTTRPPRKRLRDDQAGDSDFEYISNEERDKEGGKTVDNKMKDSERTSDIQNSPNKKEDAKKLAKKKRAEKKRERILKQQEELEGLFAQARHVNLENLPHWEQEEVLLSDADIADLKQHIRKKKAEEKERTRTIKEREKELLADWKKTRDDALCDDLKPLPQFRSLQLPAWITPDLFGELLYVYQFFQCFPELLPMKKVFGVRHLDFNDLVAAVKDSIPREDAPYIKIMHVLLNAKRERADEEDGDEANLNNKDEIAVDPSIDIDHKLYGCKIREATTLHETVRLTHGLSPRRLPITWMTVTEVLRLVLLTSGYYTGVATHRFRLFSRGSHRCYEDEGFVFAQNNPETMSALERKTLFDLSPFERIALLKVIIQQLLSYHKFRTVIDDRISSLFDMKKELNKIRNFDISQEKEAREARLLREYEAEQIEEFGEAVRSDFVKREPMTRETGLLVAYLHNELFVGRNEEKLAEVKESLLTGIAFGQLDLEDIEKARSIQKERLLEVQTDLLESICKLHSRIGWISLGRDRAFRHYWFIDSIPILLVENVISHNETGPCGEVTPLDKVDVELRKQHATDDELRKFLLGCTASTDCPIHGEHRRPRWQYVESAEQLEQIRVACNSRGYRENELGENIAYFKLALSNSLERFTEKLNNDQLYARLGFKECNIESIPEAFDWEQAFVNILLGLEERIEQGCIGHITARCSREDWKQSLLERKSVTNYVEGDVKVFGDVVYTIEEVKRLDTVGQLAVAFLQLVQGINLKFLRLPFATPSNRDIDCANIATTTFDQWQKALLRCVSISALSLFYATLELGILWSKSRLQSRCRVCKKKGEVENLYMCTRCDQCYHANCVKPKIKVPEKWLCPDCRTLQKSKEIEESWKKRQSTKDIQKEDSENFDEPNEEYAGTSADGKDDNAAADLETFEEFSLPSDMLKTSSGRLVKKVVYSDQPETSERRKPRTRCRIADKSDNDSSSNDADYVRPKRRQTSNAVNKAVSMNLRESNHRTRDALRAIEGLINDAMRLPSSWPFLEPVDARLVPDYHQIIKRPMDLRTMMNKLKQRLYDHPDEVVADARLIIENCRIYNEEESEICRCAEKLEEFLGCRLAQAIAGNTTNGRTRSSR